MGQSAAVADKARRPRRRLPDTIYLKLWLCIDSNPFIKEQFIRIEPS
jgi:hypothetical protein